MPRNRAVAPLSVSDLQEASQPVALPDVSDAFDPPPPEHERKIRSSPEAARKRRTLPTAIAEAPPPGYHSLPRRLPPAIVAREIALALGDLGDAEENDATTDTQRPEQPDSTGDSRVATPPPQVATAPASTGQHPQAAAVANSDAFTPPPPPPAGQGGATNRFLALESARPRGVTTDNFRMAVWTYSPKKPAKKAHNSQPASPVEDNVSTRPVPSPIPLAASSTSPAVTTATAAAATAAETAQASAPRSYLNTTLPPEVFEIAFGFLPISDLAIASQVCRAWFVAADPWAYTEQHGWVPLGPLSRAAAIVLRVAPHDQRVTPDLLRCIKFSCTRLTLELGGSVAAAAAALPPVVFQRRDAASGDVTLGEETPPLTQLRALRLERPSPEDLRLLKQRLIPRTPVLADLRVSRVSLPVGAHELIDLVRGTKLRELRLQRVSNITRSTLAGMFTGCPALAVVHLDQCTFVGDRAPPSGAHTQQQQRPRPSLTPTGVAPSPPTHRAGDSGASVSAPSTKHRISGRVVAARQGFSRSSSPQGAPYRVLEMIAHGEADARPQRSGGAGGVNSARGPGMAAQQRHGAQCMACVVQGSPCDEHRPPGPADQHRSPAVPAPGGFSRFHGVPAPPTAAFQLPATAREDVRGPHPRHLPHAPMMAGYGGNFNAGFVPAGFGHHPTPHAPRALVPRLPGTLFDASAPRPAGEQPSAPSTSTVPNVAAAPFRPHPQRGGYYAAAAAHVQQQQQQNRALPLPPLPHQ